MSRRRGCARALACRRCWRWLASRPSPAPGAATTATRAASAPPAHRRSATAPGPRCSRAVPPRSTIPARCRRRSRWRWWAPARRWCACARWQAPDDEVGHIAGRLHRRLDAREGGGAHLIGRTHHAADRDRRNAGPRGHRVSVRLAPSGRSGNSSDINIHHRSLRPLSRPGGAKIGLSRQDDSAISSADCAGQGLAGGERT